MENVLSELIDGIKNRITSPLLSTFMISRLLFNRNFVYTMLFVDEGFIFQKYGLLKSEYLSNLFYNHELITKLIGYTHSDIWISSLRIIINFFIPSLSDIGISSLSTGISFLIPLLIVMVIYKIIYPVEEYVYTLDQKHLRNKKSAQQIEESKFLDNAISNHKKRNDLSSLAKKEKLEPEYQALVKSYEEEFQNNFENIRSHVQDATETGTQVPNNILSAAAITFFERYGIIMKGNISDLGKIHLTQKGRDMVDSKWYFTT